MFNTSNFIHNKFKIQLQKPRTIDCISNYHYKKYV